LAINGIVSIDKTDDSTGRLLESFVLPINRVQLEQDTAKSLKELLHIPDDRQSDFENSPLKNIYLDHNRAGIPLIEIITPPVLPSGVHAATAFSKIADLLYATGVTTADLHFGAMRCDVNVSLGYHSPRTEIKNLNSIRAVREACSYEIEYQVDQIEKNGILEQNTKRWDGEKTILIREKEGEKDYR
jgi:aspartyl-tRNA(Asn)/glutamyl-tRNA(Gln) amidotransferase subunit B